MSNLPSQISDATGLQAIVDDVAGNLPDVECLLGTYELLRNGSPPRIVFEPTSDSFLPVAARVPVGVVDPRALLTDRAGFSAYVWGRPRDNSPGFVETQTLRDALVNALLMSVLHDYRLTNGEWPKQALTDLGVVYILSFTVDFPILKTTTSEDTTLLREIAVISIEGGDGESVTVTVP